MNVSDNCAICRVCMIRGQVLRIHPCNHIFHAKCSEEILATPNAQCPMCRTEVTGRENIIRKKYENHTNTDRERIVSCANRGEDWVILADTLKVKYKTAYTWVKSGRQLMDKKGGIKPKALTEDQLDV